MTNNPDDKVKVYFVPCYLNGKDGVFNKEYCRFVIGTGLRMCILHTMNLGVYALRVLPSGVPTITTDLARFGLWVNGLDTCNLHKWWAEVLHRTDSNYMEVADSIKNTITVFAFKTAEETAEISGKATAIAEKAVVEALYYVLLRRFIILFYAMRQSANKIKIYSSIEVN